MRKSAEQVYAPATRTLDREHVAWTVAALAALNMKVPMRFSKKAPSLLGVPCPPSFPGAGVGYVRRTSCDTDHEVFWSRLRELTPSVSQ